MLFRKIIKLIQNKFTDSQNYLIFLFYLCYHKNYIKIRYFYYSSTKNY